MKQTIQGIVTSNSDPAKAGRIKVALPQTDGQEYPEWIEPVFTPGWFSPPEPGATVDVELPHGDDLVEFAHEVKYRGQIHEEGNTPPDALQSPKEKTTRRGYFTKAGHLLVFDDEGGKESITLTHGKAGSVIEMDKDGTVKVTADKVHLNAGETELSDTSTDFVLLGQTFHAAFSALVGAWSTALGQVNAPIDPDWIAYKASMVTALTTNFIPLLPTFLSTKTKTG